MTQHQPDLFPTRTATVSMDGRYRYDLQRSTGLPRPGVGSVLFVMLNPSIADAAIDDPTIRKCMGFATRLCAASLTVVNLYAFRATDPINLRKAYQAGTNIVGLDNDATLRRHAATAERVIVAWGALHLGALSDHAHIRACFVAHMIRQTMGAAVLLCLGRARNGEPRHPLMVAYATPLESWP